MTGKLLGILIVATALIFGAVVYYFQVFYYYDRVDPTGIEVALALPGGGQEQIPFENFEAIDAISSPIRFRACFTTEADLGDLTERFESYPGAEPRNAPFWFSCFDAENIGEMIEDGRAQVFLGEGNIEFGVDRVTAITDDGRGYTWHELNDCGQKAYDGTPLGDHCPPRPD